MKKQLLILFLLFSFFQSRAQVFEWGSKSYEVSYWANTTNSSCLTETWAGNGGYAYTGGNVKSMSLDQGPLIIVTKPTAIPEGAPDYKEPSYVDLYFTPTSEPNAACASMRSQYLGDPSDHFYYHVNMSGGNAKMIIYAKANVPTTADVSLAYNEEWGPDMVSSYKDGITRTISLTTTLQAFELDFSDWENRSRVNLYGLYFNDPNVTIEVEKVILGSATRSAFYNHIEGHVFDDRNSDCLLQTGEKGIRNILVKASNGSDDYYAFTDSTGHYSIGVDSGTATFEVLPVYDILNTRIYNQVCASASVNTSGASDVFCCTDLGIHLNLCALLQVEVYANWLRRCFKHYTIVTINNMGTVGSQSAVVKVIYPPYVVPISSTPAWNSKVGDTLFYELPSFDVYRGEFIVIQDSVVCGIEEIRGLTQCIKAVVQPYSNCMPVDPLWDGSSVEVSSECLDTLAHFEISNTGAAMTAESEYRVYANDTLIYVSSFRLNAGESFDIHVPVESATIRLEADQSPFHPGHSMPRAFVDACGFLPNPSLFRPDYIRSVQQDDLDEWVAISCLPITDSYDPNDKEASPAGHTDEHLIEAGKTIQYTIRFQNTGSALAYKIKVVDTLDNHLDLSSFVRGASSHPYHLELTSTGDGNVLNFIFDNINLKDSITSEPESHGFVSFYINSKAALADGSTIHNKADIFFDYNSAIVTNVVNHTIGTYTVTDFTKGNSIQIVTGLFDNNQSNTGQKVMLYPNPASDVIQVKLDQHISDGRLIILDLSGQEVFSSALKEEITSVSLSGLSTGMYLYKVMSKGEFVGVGKLLVK